MSGLKGVKAVVVGQKCEEKTIFSQYEIFVDFDDGYCEVEHVNPEHILNRVNDWLFCKHVSGPLGKDHIEASELGHRFTWPDYPSEICEGLPQRVVGFQIYYYDAYGVKHYTSLIHFS